MSRNGKTTVAKQLKRERIIIDGASGKEVDRISHGKSKLDGEISREDEIANLKARLKQLEGND